MPDFTLPTQSISVVGRRGGRPVEAVVLGALAVNELSPGVWVVTHVPTGMWIGDRFDDLAGAVMYAGCLATIGVDWTPLRPAISANQRNLIRHLAAEIRRALAEEATP